MIDPNLFGTTLLVDFADKFGPEAVEDWDPETIQREILLEGFPEFDSTNNFGKLMAAISIIRRPELFYKSLPGFIVVLNALNGYPDGHQIFRLPTVEDLAWGLTEATIIQPPDDPEAVHPEIRHFLGAVMDHEGVSRPIGMLKLAQTPSYVLDRRRRGVPPPDPETESHRAYSLLTTVNGALARLAKQLAALELVNPGNSKFLLESLEQKTNQQGKRNV